MVMGRAVVVGLVGLDARLLKLVRLAFLIDSHGPSCSWDTGRREGMVWIRERVGRQCDLEGMSGAATF